MKRYLKRFGAKMGFRHVEAGPSCESCHAERGQCRGSPRCQGLRRMGARGRSESVRAAALDLSITIHRLALLVNHEAMSKRLTHAVY